MAQNTSSAVMQQRSEPDDSLDDFPTQPWATRALMEHVLLPGSRVADMRSVWEPACNRGHMARPLKEYFQRVHTSDIFDYGNENWCQDRVVDFLWPDPESPHIKSVGVDWIITNPPFRLAEQFIFQSNRIARIGCAMIVRTSFLEGVGRYQRLFSVNPPTIVAQFVERVPMVKGRLSATVSTATSYCWLVFIKDMEPRPMMWIPPCRKQLERAEDYA